MVVGVFAGKVVVNVLAERWTCVFPTVLIAVVYQVSWIKACTFCKQLTDLRTLQGIQFMLMSYD